MIVYMSIASLSMLVSCNYTFTIQPGYKEPSIISGTDAAIWSKINFVPTGHHHPPSSPFRAYAPFQALLPFFKCILEVVFWEGV
jgi:hypothetical protein